MAGSFPEPGLPQIWQQCVKTTDLRVVGVRVTENAGEIAK
jgi:hypothetical protein